MRPARTSHRPRARAKIPEIELRFGLVPKVLALINEDVLRRACLTPKWVTFCGQMNHYSFITNHPSQLSLSSLRDK